MTYAVLKVVSDMGDVVGHAHKETRASAVGLAMASAGDGARKYRVSQTEILVTGRNGSYLVVWDA